MKAEKIIKDIETIVLLAFYSEGVQPSEKTHQVAEAIYKVIVLNLPHKK